MKKQSEGNLAKTLDINSEEKAKYVSTFSRFQSYKGMHQSAFKCIYMVLFWVMLLLPVGSVLSQPPAGRGIWQERYRQLESQRVAYITRQLSLTPEEAQVFWPIYNEYNARRNQMMIRFRLQRTDDIDLELLNDRELEEMADMEVESLDEMAKLRIEYHERFKSVLPIRKVVQLYEAERGFNRHLLQEGRGLRQGPRGRN